MTETAGTSGAVAPNGPGAATLLAAGIGAAVLGVAALAGDAFAGIAHVLTVSRATGPLSGVTDVAILAWLVSWSVLARRWARRDVPLGRIIRITAALFALGLLLTFPPFMDLLQGK